MKNILILDECARRKYSSSSLGAANNGIGGTESTVIRVAEKLAEEHRVVVMQAVRQPAEAVEENGVSWTSVALSKEALDAFDHVVAIRRIKSAVRVRRLHRRVPVTLWYHDWYAPKVAAEGARRHAIRQFKRNLQFAIHHYLDVGGIAVTATHAANLEEYVNRSPLARLHRKKARLTFVYNPLAPDMPAPGGDYDRDKLIFASAPWKGLDLVLARFAEIRKDIPELRLHVASPGYQVAEGADGSGVIYMGALDHPRLMQEIRSSLCLFYPADRVPETFGLVFAESNAVGTPVLTHPFGAAPELLDPGQLVDAHDTQAILARIRAWRDGARPAVSRKPGFDLPSIAAAWNAALFGDLRSRA